MLLTAGEFCQFNLRSRIQLLEREGVLINKRNVADKYVVKLYSIYRFLVEVIIRAKTAEVIEVNPVWNKDVIDLY